MVNSEVQEKESVCSPFRFVGKRLGKVCKRGHDHGGGSYRHKDNTCVDCANLASKNYYHRDKDRIASRRAVYMASDKMRQYRKNWQKINSDKAAAYANKRRAKKLRATPKWANHAKIEAIYSEAKRLTEINGVEYHVDHIIPLQHPLVCGLHVHQNLQVILGSENMKKSNKFQID